MLLRRRPGHFDSAFPEVGPPSLLTIAGLSSSTTARTPRSTERRDAANAYSDGQALFSADDPRKLIARTDKPFFKPEQPGNKAASMPREPPLRKG